ncbi:hypothetical protein [Rhizobium leguminosarum]|uniref:hypothetical protein n=1 Tax=Rhizobium leguminosarum TaxID=384 RepID=UPI003F9E0DB9
MVMHPVIAYLIKTTDVSDPVRSARSPVVTVPIVYGLAWVGYNLIEMSGQNLGRGLTKPHTSV